MSNKMIQVRNVPAFIHRTLKARAAAQGTTLSEYLLAEMKLLAQRPTLDQLSIRSQTRPTVTVDIAALVRTERGARK
jgi:antitoxin FitA